MPKRSEYIAWGATACAYARAVIDECATEINISKEVIWDRYLKVNRVRFNLFSNQESFYRLAGMPNDNLFLWMKRSLKNARAIRAGNCTEYARLAFNYLRKKITTGTKIEILTIPAGDHVFVVIGRSKGLQALAQGEDDTAVICDPYSTREEDRVYPAKEIKVRLRCFRDYTNDNEPWPYKNEEIVFDPGMHKLEIYYVQEAVIDAACSRRDIAAAMRRLNIINTNLKILLDNRDVVDRQQAERVCAAMQQIVFDVTEYQTQFNTAALQKDNKQSHVIAVQRYLNKKIRESIQILYSITGLNVLKHQLGEQLILDVLLDDVATITQPSNLSGSIYKLINHMNDDVLTFVFSVMAKYNLFNWVSYVRYTDRVYEEKNLTLLTLLLKRRNSIVFDHLLSLLSDQVIYECLIQRAEPFDRFLKWIELYPECEGIINTVLHRLEDLLNPFEVRSISAISTEYHEAVLKNDVLARKLLFVNNANSRP